MKTIKPIALLLLIPLPGCVIGQIDHEVYENKMREEQRQVLAFVKSNNELIREVHNIKNVSVITWSFPHRENDYYPYKYAVSVSGDKSTVAVVNVSRSFSRSVFLGNMQFTLACFGHFPAQDDIKVDRYNCKNVQLDDRAERKAAKAIQIAYPGILQNAGFVAVETTLGSDVNGFASKGEKVWHVTVRCHKTLRVYAKFFVHPQSGEVFSILKAGEKGSAECG
jgi:hypothetical protein